jgi:hypothetical protein
MRPLAITLALVGAMACGMDTGGLKPSPSDGSFTATDSQAAANDGHTSESAADSSRDSAAPSSDGSMPNDSSNLTTDAMADAGHIMDSSPSDVGTDDHVALDGGALCDQLLQCCGHIKAPPPLARACRLAVQQLDAGDGGTCESTWELLQDAGLCP